MKTILCAIEMRAGCVGCISATGNFIEKAGVYDKPALMLVNRSGTAHPATGGEVMTLTIAIQTSVYERFGLWLEPEPVVV